MIRIIDILEPGCAFESRCDGSASSALAGQRTIAPVFHQRLKYLSNSNVFQKPCVSVVPVLYERLKYQIRRKVLQIKFQNLV